MYGETSARWQSGVGHDGRALPRLRRRRLPPPLPPLRGGCLRRWTVVEAERGRNSLHIDLGVEDGLIAGGGGRAKQQRGAGNTVDCPLLFLRLLGRKRRPQGGGWARIRLQAAKGKSSRGRRDLVGIAGKTATQTQQVHSYPLSGYTWESLTHAHSTNTFPSLSQLWVFNGLANACNVPPHPPSKKYLRKTGSSFRAFVKKKRLTNTSL